MSENPEPKYRLRGGDGAEYGPVSGAEMRTWRVEGRATAESLVSRDGGEWLPFSSFPELAGPTSAPVPTAPLSMGAVPAGPRNNPFALTGMILGICSLTVGLCCCYGFPFSISGIVFSIVSLVQIKNSNGAQTGRGMAIAGLICSILSIVLVIILIIVGVTLNFDEIRRELRKV